MRITHVTDYYLPRLGGIELQVHDLSHRQVADGHLVDLVTATRPGRAGDPADADTGAGAGAGVTVHRRGVPRLLGGLYSPLGMRRVARTVRAAKTDVLHAHVSTMTLTTWCAIRAAVGQGIPVVVTVHSMLQGVAPLMRVLDRLFGWRSWPITYTAVSEVAADGVRALLPAGTPVGVVPNGVDPEWWTPPVRAAAAPSSPGEVVVVAVMRLSRRKRGRELIEAVRVADTAVGDDVRIRLVIAGDGVQRRDLERQIRKAGQAGQVELLGRVTRSRVRELLATADVFAAPAVLESFGIAALEARLAGVPVVARAQSGVSDFVQDGRHGLLVDDDAGLAAALARLAADPGLRARLRAASLAEAPPLGWERTVAAVDRAYADATAQVGR